MHYKTKHVLITAGNDFTFRHARVQYKFLEDAFSTLKETAKLYKKKIDFKFSTLDDYFKALKEEQRK